MMGNAAGGSEIHRDALIGKLALDRRWVTATQLREALSEQWTEVENGKPEPRPLGAILVSRGLLTEVQLHELESEVRASVPAFPPFGKYTLLREIGRGAMGVVYDAHDENLGRRVALKMLIAPPGRDPVEMRPEQERFLRESRLHRGLPPHPGLVPVLEAGVIDGRWYLAMELVDGVSMAQWQRSGSITVRQRVAMLRDVAVAVHHAHRHGIIHRDLKPENILVDRRHQARITDFGLAKLVGASAPVSTAAGVTLGTPAYMSPEQVRGAKEIDARSDLYALGVMLYEILTGRRPFSGDSPYEVMMKTANEEVLPPSKITSIVINPTLLKNLENICLIALSKNPADRYPDAEAFARDLTKWLKGEDVRVVLPRRWRLWRTKRLVPVLAGALLLLAALGAGALALRSRPSDSLKNAIAPTPAIVTDTLQPGCIAEYYAGMNFNVLGLRKIDARPAFDDPADPLWSQSPGWYTSRRWTGFLRVATTGKYHVHVSAREFARLTLGDAELFAGAGSGTVAIPLQAGLHRFRLEHAHQGADDTVSIAWMKEGDTGAATLGPGTLLHAPNQFTAVTPQPAGRESLGPVPGAEEGETLKVRENTGSPVVRKSYGPFSAFWKGTWSGTDHLFWSPRKIGDRLRLEFAAGETGTAMVALGLTRTCDHGIFRISVNKTVVAEALDLWGPDLATAETEFRNVKLRAGANELEFEVVGSNPSAREWADGNGLYKLGLDYVVVR